MDPNVQVALVSVFATVITTAGVVLVAVINNRRERSGAASAGVEAGLDEKDVLGRMLALITENERKEQSIHRLSLAKAALEDEVRQLQAEIHILRTNRLPEEQKEEP